MQVAENDMRFDGRRADELRPVKFQRGFTRTAPGSVLVEMGKTRVICTACFESGVPTFLVGKGKGWLTAEYAMLPASTSPRKPRDRAGKVDGRSVEIQRLIGRSLRNVVNLEALGENTVWIDCDVLEADGGTRTASITGAFVALVDAVARSEAGSRLRSVIIDSVAAVSVGIVAGEVVLDLPYSEDVAAEVDMNLVMTGGGKFIEVQGTGEKQPFTGEQLDLMLRFGRKGIGELTALQTQALAGIW